MQLNFYQKFLSKLMFYLTTFPVSVFIYQAIKKLSLVFLKLKIQITTITACYKGDIKVQGVGIFINGRKLKKVENNLRIISTTSGNVVAT